MAEIVRYIQLRCDTSPPTIIKH